MALSFESDIVRSVRITRIDKKGAPGVSNRAIEMLYSVLLTLACTLLEGGTISTEEYSYQRADTKDRDDLPF